MFNKIIHEFQPCLKVQQLVVDLLDVDVGPKDVIVTIDCFDDVVVKAIQLLEKSQLCSNLHQLRMLGNSDSKQLCSVTVCGVLPEQIIKLILRAKTKQKKCLWCSWRNNFRFGSFRNTSQPETWWVCHWHPEEQAPPPSAHAVEKREERVLECEQLWYTANL